MDKNDNGIPDKVENIIVIICGVIMIAAGVTGIFFNMDVAGTISLCSLGSFMISEERVKKYLENK